MLGEIRDQFKTDLETVPWMDDSTRPKAVQKVCIGLFCVCAGLFCSVCRPLLLGIWASFARYIGLFCSFVGRAERKKKRKKKGKKEKNVCTGLFFSFLGLFCSVYRPLWLGPVRTYVCVCVCVCVCLSVSVSV